MLTVPGGGWGGKAGNQKNVRDVVEKTSYFFAKFFVGVGLPAFGAAQQDGSKKGIDWCTEYIVLTATDC